MQVRKQGTPMDLWLSQDLATQLVRERIADAAAQLRAAELTRDARAAARSASASDTLRRRLAHTLRGFALRLDPTLAPIGR
jgi:alkylation response protein AidB-like acyl-CoA dehydrogenase